MVTILQGDCIEMMRPLPDESVQCCVTSPPYWGLRDYQLPSTIWPESIEASDGCEHEWEPRSKRGGGAYKEGSKKRWQHSAGDFGRDDRFLDGHPEIPAGAFCQTCNAWRGVFGLEPTPELYIAHLVSIMSEARRVLRNDGTLWLNLGDSYATAPHGSGSTFDPKWPNARDRKEGFRCNRTNRATDIGLKPGDMVGIPWRAAFALQTAGWFLRRDNIWFKPNPMPESVNGWRWEKHRVKVGGGWTMETHPSRLGGQDKSRSKCFGSHNGTKPSENAAEYVDCAGCEKCAPNGGLILRKGNWRCTTSHEYVFQFSKSASYFCDAEAAREVISGTTHARGSGVNPKAAINGSQGRASARSKQNTSFSAAVAGLVGNRNRRSVWRIATKPYRGAHFATFPPDLVRPVILAASPVKACGECGAPYAPVIERGEPALAQQRACGGDVNGHYNGTATKDFAGAGAEDASAVKARILAGMVTKTVIGHRPTCGCSILGKVPDPVAPIVLDMFGGSGTVGQVAQELGRHAILIELSAAYIPLIEKRCGLSSDISGIRSPVSKCG